MGRPPLLVSREVIKLVLNHSDGSVTGIYDLATREPEIENALRLWGNRLDDIVHGWGVGQRGEVRFAYPAVWTQFLAPGKAPPVPPPPLGKSLASGRAVSAPTLVFNLAAAITGNQDLVAVTDDGIAFRRPHGRDG